MKLFTSLLMSAIFTLCSCGKAPPKPFLGTNGKTSYSINCIYEADYCLLQAETLCPNGYEIISGSTPQSKNRKESVKKTAGYNLVVECK